MTPRPKFAYIRSPKLLKACRDLPCQICGIEDGTIVAAHSNQGRHGKGRSIKASDVFVASLCHYCHYEIDQGGTYPAEERQLIWQSAHVRTVASLVREGRWPPGVPIPPSDPIDPQVTHCGTPAPPGAECVNNQGRKA